MVNKKFWLGILVMVLVFGMTVIGCDNDSTGGNDGSTNGGGGGTGSALNGTWIGKNTQTGNDHGEMRMNNGNYDYFGYFTNNVVQKGTYTVNGNIINYSHTHFMVNQSYDDGSPIYGSTQFEKGRLYSRGEAKSILQITTDEELNNIISSFAPTSAEYFSNESKFILGSITYTRK